MPATVSYETLLDDLNEKQNLLQQQYNFSYAKDSWYWEALSTLSLLITAIKNDQKIKNENNDDNFWNRVFTSLGLLLELSGVLNVAKSLDKKSLEIYLSKLKLTLKGPLLMNDENNTNNIGRNTLFELKLFSRLVKNGYNATLYYDHPDISFQVKEREYVIECKRIYKPETLIKNSNAALNQLIDYSLYKPKPEGIYARYGIVAISLSRYIHSGDKLLEATSEEKAKERINYEMKKIFDENRDELLRPYPVQVPALILEYSDRGSIDIPYTYNFIDVHETSNGYSRFKYIVDDLNKLKD